jgi:hypothetical protein
VNGTAARDRLASLIAKNGFPVTLKLSGASPVDAVAADLDEAWKFDQDGGTIKVVRWLIIPGHWTISPGDFIIVGAYQYLVNEVKPSRVGGVLVSQDVEAIL